MSEEQDDRDDCPFKFATLDVCDCVEKNMLDRIEALTAKLAKAVEALEVIRDRQYYRMGPGVTAQVIARATLAEIKGESHE
jgi:hypothetical protein